ncbi:phospholipase D family protein [Variovorax sp. ZT4R33]|uniref:phospholipase D family protein n=1 Tax=Variovorax sp. ZT4R33 TaxID=3443743 RepID=UPI003F48A734
MPPLRVFRRPFRAQCLALLLPLFLAVGCAELPKNVERPVSTALSSTDSTPLAALVAQRRTDARARFDSGFLLLEGPQVAYGSRLALVEAAQKTLDLQYYAIHADASTERLLRGVVQAARRGVRVRVLLDDFHSTGRNALVMRLAFEPNIQMRMFNPVAGARGSSLVRLFNAAGDFDRVQQRMHNKLFIADNAMGVTGGRNLGDAYFGIAKSRNFVDLDVLAAGPIVQDMSRSFDHYWNDERAYPVQSLIDRETLQKLRDKTRAADAAQRQRDNEPGDPNAPKPPDGEPRPSDAGPTDAQRAAAWDEKPLDLRNAAFVWAPAALLADRPAKIAAESGATVVDDTAGAPSLVVTQPRNAAAARRLTALEDASGAADGGETVVSGLLQLIGQARSELTIISPYFVPGPDMKQAFASARSRGVRVRVLTNSLASNDAPIAHVGYARHREELLAMGVELYELRSEQAGLGSAFGSSGSSTTGESRSMLHSKALVLDDQLLVIGSMNLDLRSQLQNTEIALLIRSQALSRIATTQIETAMTKGAWHVERSDGGLIWRAPQDSGLQDTRTEPDASAGLRLLLKIFGPLAPDELL